MRRGSLGPSMRGSSCRHICDWSDEVEGSGSSEMKVIITGGAGFIGCNAAARYLRRGDQVVVIDNLSRPGTDKNLEWLQTQGTVEFAKHNIADFPPVRDTIAKHRD